MQRKIYDERFENSRKRKFVKPLLSIYNNYGVIKDNLKQQDSALFYYFKGLDIKVKAKDAVGIPYSLNNIRNLHPSKNLILLKNILTRQ
jgi:hypothetical protein